ncbi:unnamed protein product [Effrenium voratum]|uniref:Uncharacterized protein n=1 Tax=Effrenium voratum TaxID=2562239 RepID=A0AA36MUP7_9DINO|nr:unnamed protein product [Effrenium voratum]CAJ1429619.1 unnamed protein product [Effrenium voratum]
MVYVFYVGTWTGERPKNGLQYFAQSGLVIRRTGNTVLMRFSDGEEKWTKNWSQVEPPLPGGFRQSRKIRHANLSSTEPTHHTGHQLEGEVFYTGTVVNKWSGASYFGQPAKVESFMKDSAAIRIRFSDDSLRTTCNVSRRPPKLWESNFRIGDELYYSGSWHEYFGKRAKITALLPETPRGVRIEFRDGTARNTTIQRLQEAKPLRTETFQPPERVKLKQLVNGLAMGMAQMRISADDFMHRIALRDIFYTQDSIKRFFQDGRPLEKMEAELRYGVKDVTDIPCITVVPHMGRMFSVDNRRLWVFKKVFPASQKVPVQIGDQDTRFWNKLTTQNHGAEIRIR